MGEREDGGREDRERGDSEREDGERGDNVVHVDFRRGRVLDRDGVASSASALDADPVEPVEGDGDTPTPASKHEHFAGLIEHGLVLVTLDTRAPGVSVPDSFRGTPQLHLSFSHRFGLDDFAFDENSIRATLSFEGGPHYCVVPWDAVYAMSSEELDERRVFRESFPPELLALLPQLSDDDQE